MELRVPQLVPLLLRGGDGCIREKGIGACQLAAGARLHAAAQAAGEQVLPPRYVLSNPRPSEPPASSIEPPIFCSQWRTRAGTWQAGAQPLIILDILDDIRDRRRPDRPRQDTDAVMSIGRAHRHCSYASQRGCR